MKIDPIFLIRMSRPVGHVGMGSGYSGDFNNVQSKRNVGAVKGSNEQSVQCKTGRWNYLILVAAVERNSIQELTRTSPVPSLGVEREKTPYHMFLFVSFSIFIFS
jgi:hypothetical protein